MSRGKKMVGLVTESSKLNEEDPKNDTFIAPVNSNSVKFQILENVELEYIDQFENPIIETVTYDESLTNFSTENDSLNLLVPSENSLDQMVGNPVSLPVDTNILESMNDVPSQYCGDRLNVDENEGQIEPNLDSILPLQVFDDLPSGDILNTNNNSDTWQHDTNKNLGPQTEADINREFVSQNDTDANRDFVPQTDTDSNSSLPVKQQKRKKRSLVNKSEWFVEQNKKRREEGKKYLGREKINGSWIYDKPKKEREMQSRCSCKISKYSTLKCATIDEDTRKEIFKHFWNLSWGEKKTLVNATVNSMPTVRPRNRKKSDSTKRSTTFVYHLKVNDQNVKVCRKMFLSTLGIGRWTVHHWKTTSKSKAPSTYRDNTKSNSMSESTSGLIEFLLSLPVMESHYCRSTSRKLYLLPEWKSKQEVYNFYVNDWCVQRNLKPLSICTFSNLFEEKNYALFQPKKDECEKCACHKVGTISDEEHKLHLERKEQARREKDQDKNSNHYVFTVDLQAVLMAPKSNVSTLYYKTKLQVHNLCFFNLKNKDGFCFLWNEVEGGLNAEEFASIWVDFLENTIIPNIIADGNNEKKIIIIYSDGCTYQNRNCVLSNALLNVAMRYENITIEQKFLEVGHTQMEADSMHSTIERQLKDRIINVPADYISVVKRARRCPAPYTVKYLDHKYFKKFEKVQFYKSIRPGRSKGDPKVTDIRALRYESNGQISYKISFNDEWKYLPQRRSLQISPYSMDELTSLHESRRKITARKFEDLQQIKVTLPADYHKFYDELPHE